MGSRRTQDDPPRRTGQTEDRKNPGEQSAFERVDVIRDAIRGVHQGQQPCSAPTGRTHGCTRPVLIANKPLVPQGPSTHGSTATSLHSYASAGAVHPITSTRFHFARRSQYRSLLRRRRRVQLFLPIQPDINRYGSPDHLVERWEDAQLLIIWWLE